MWNDAESNPRPDGVPVQRADGSTKAERYLQRLCERSFLRFWSYPRVFRDQGKGKEICDLLVVFDEHILIFSDKDCVFPETANVHAAWSRWFRRAVMGGARQIWGAERWIRSHPDRIFLDCQCTRRFPFPLPDMASAKFHRIVVAHNASVRCAEYYGGSGSLMLDSSIVGDAHIAPPEKGGQPFVIGQLDPAMGYVHVFDDTVLEIVMRTLDTAGDFIGYLEKKENLISSKRLVMGAGEEELLAVYLGKINGRGEHDFVFPGHFTAIGFDEGHWSKFSHDPQRLRQIAADRISYAWDRLIEKFSHHVMNGTQYFSSSSGPSESERALRFMARERRTRRRILARCLLELVHTTDVKGWLARVMIPSGPLEPHYVFVVVSRPDGKPDNEYRELRFNLLRSYCQACKHVWPKATDIVGIATEPANEQTQSEDYAYLDSRTWSAEDAAEAEHLHKEFGLLARTKRIEFTHREYPDAPGHPLRTATLRKHPRNAPCPCGSGLKYKKCCGR